MPNETVPSVAFVPAAGLGTRMRPLTDKRPKPLVEVAGRALLDHVLDRLAAAGIERAVVNVHYLADQIERHLAGRGRPRIAISDERAQLLDTGGGVAKALPLLGAEPFVVHNSDTIWHEQGTDNLRRLMTFWSPPRMDLAMLLARRDTSLGYDGHGDFELDADGRIRRRAPGTTATYVFAGVSIMAPSLLADAPPVAFSLNRPWDQAIASGRACAIVLDGTWMHVGDPAALAAAERFLGAAHGRG
ncbi:MAG TPA: nucleotidyltransferase family protein [Hyphomicrobiaceae bacterium]|nr:nucleotidyltransferase family protein [Hyphomicrobiaceae bacterium]